VLDQNIEDRTMTLVIPVPPVAMGRPRFWNGIAVTPPKTRAAKRMLSVFLKNHFREPTSSALSVRADFILRPPKRCKRRFPTARPDTDNYLKLLLDAGNGIAWKDDAQIIEIHARKLYDWSPQAKPRIELTINEIEERKTK
jgi:Holliday junction resolvase RusA-like endonuclease